MNNCRRFLQAASVTVLILGGTALTQHTASAATDLQVRVDVCSGDHYPRIVCDVAVQDAAGRPIDHLDARSFGVKFDDLPVAYAKITTAEASVERSELVLVLDDGLTSRSKYANQWVRSADAILQDLPSGHGAMTIHASEAQSPALPLMRNTPDGLRKAREQLRIHKLTAHARLYDALCDAAAHAGRRLQQVVWLALVSDGFDRGSTVCNLDEAVRAIERVRAPVLVIGVGPYAGELRRIAAASNGIFADAANPDEVTAAMREVMQRARQRYIVEFVVPQPADGREHTVTVAVRGAAHDSAPVDALPLAPALLGVNLSSDGLALSTTSLPARGRVRMEPRFAGKGASAAEFVLDGMRTRVDVPPYFFEFDGARLPSDRPSVLSVTVYGASGEASAESTTVLQMAPEGSAAAFQIDPAGAGVRAWVAGSAGSLAAGTASALLLGAALATLIRRPRYWMTAMRSESDAPPRASIRSDSYEAATIVQRSEARVLRDGAGAGRLHLLIHAPGAGAQHVKLTDAGVLGRDAAGIRNEIAVSSSYVSLRHARFSSIGEGWQVEDLRSVNGVRHNGIALQPGAAALLRPGDRVMCADVLVEVVAVAVNSADAAPASAA